jgi:uncharacterized protein involved in exopolysaccharide biosynthesis
MIDLLPSVIRKRWRWLIAVPAMSVIVGLVAVILQENHYTSHTSFIPAAKSASGLGGLADLAAAAGVMGTVQANPASPQFYEQLLTAAPIVDGVLEANYPRPRRGYRVSAGADSARLWEILVPNAKPHERRLADAAKKFLSEDVSTGLDRRTGIVSLDVRLNDPDLAARVADEFLAQIDVFNRSSLQTQARARRVFTEARAADAQQALAAAESALRAFLEGNRQYLQSPTLQFEQERLQRQLSLNQELYLSLRRELDLARIREVDDIPTITVIEHARPAVEKSGPHRLLTIAAIMVLSLLGTAFGLALYDQAETLLRARAEPAGEGRG